MKTSPDSPSLSVLAFGAHPDDIEFGCGGVIAREVLLGRMAHFVVCSRGESSTHGTPAQRCDEAKASAKILGATLDFEELGGDSHFEVNNAAVLRLAARIRALAPRIVLAPTPTENQHPDHAKLGQMVRDAARLARYGGVEELRALPPHAIDQLLFYAVTPGAETLGAAHILIDVSDPKVVSLWKAAMEAHATQSRTRDYSELQLARARQNGLLAGGEYAIPLWPNDDLVFSSLGSLAQSARRF